MTLVSNFDELYTDYQASESYQMWTRSFGQEKLSLSARQAPVVAAKVSVVGVE